MQQLKIEYKSMRPLYLGCIIFIILLFVACDTGNQSKVSFYLTDAPFDASVKNVNIAISKLQYSLSDDGSWINIPITPGIYNLSNLTNGRDTLLSSVHLDEDKSIHQIRIVLGSGSNVVLTNGEVLPLDISNASGAAEPGWDLKLDLESTGNIGTNYSVIIDFDAGRSIIKTAKGAYLLKPVARTFLIRNTSSVYGIIFPTATIFKVYTIMGSDTIMTYSDPEKDNYFILRGLTSGEYKIIYENTITKESTQSASIPVVSGTNVNLGKITLEH